MPGMGGVDAARAIRERSMNRTTPILALTANVFAEDRAACIEAGMNGFVGKPVEPRALYAEILQQLGGGEAALPLAAARREPASGADAGLESRLHAVAGLDADYGLQALSGNASRYRDLLRAMVDDAERNLPALAVALERRDFVAAERLAHSTQGAAGAVGAVDLTAALRALVLALRAGAAADDAMRLAQRAAAIHADLAAAVRSLPAD